MATEIVLSAEIGPRGLGIDLCHSILPMDGNYFAADSSSSMCAMVRNIERRNTDDATHFDHAKKTLPDVASPSG